MKEAALDIDTLFGAVAELVIACGAAPLTQYPQGWEYALDTDWLLVLNGGPTDLCFHSRLRPDGMAGAGTVGVTIPAFHCYVEYHGWAAGFLSPGGGVLADGTGANVTTLYAAIQVALARERGDVAGPQS